MAIRDAIAKIALDWAVSDIAKKGENSSVFKMLSNVLPKSAKKKGKNSNIGAQGWNDPSLALGPTTSEKIMYDILLPSIGDVAKSIGNAYAFNKNAEAMALQKMAEPRQGWSGFVDDPSRYMIPYAMGQLAKGQGVKFATDVASNRLNTIADTMKQNNASARNAALALNQSKDGTLPASYWDNINRNRLDKKGAAGSSPVK